MSYFGLSHPASDDSPVLVEVPHAGVHVPDLVAEEIFAPPRAVLRDSDIYVDRLCEGVTKAGASLLVATVSRYVVDLNRAATDVEVNPIAVDQAGRTPQPRGVVWRTSTDGAKVLRAPLTPAQFQRRIELFHTPYHHALSTELDRLRTLHGHVLLLAAHSMPSMGRSGNGESRTRRADIVPGTRGGSSAHPAMVELIETHFEGAGMSVARDDPYQGGYTTAHYGRPSEGIHAVQLEINRALYVDEPSSRIKTPEFNALRELISELAAKLGALVLD